MQLAVRILHALLAKAATTRAAPNATPVTIVVLPVLHTTLVQLAPLGTTTLMDIAARVVMAVLPVLRATLAPHAPLDTTKKVMAPAAMALHLAVVTTTQPHNLPLLLHHQARLAEVVLLELLLEPWFL